MLDWEWNAPFDHDKLGNASLEVIHFGIRTINCVSLMTSTVVGLLRLSDLPRLGLLHVDGVSCVSLERVELKSNRFHCYWQIDVPKRVVCWLQEASFCKTRFIESDCMIGEGLWFIGCTDLERGIRTAATIMEEHNQFLKDKPLLVIEEGAVENRNHHPVRISHYKRLKKLVICDRNYCGGCVCSIVCNDRLQTLVVKDKCFYEGFYNSDAKGLLRISDCRSLKGISIGDSFCNYPEFQLSGKHYSYVWHRLWCSGRTDDWSRKNRGVAICDRVCSEG